MRYSVVVDLVPLRPGQAVGGTQPIRLRVSYDNERVDLRLGRSVDAGVWSQETERVLPGTRTKKGVLASSINKHIELALAEIESIFTRLEVLEGRFPSERELRANFNRFLGKPEEVSSKRRSVSFFSVYKKYIKEESVLRSWGTSHIKRHNSVHNHVKRFSPACRFSGINKEFMLSFLQFLISEDKRNTTINKILKYLKSFLKWAASEGYYMGNQHETFSPKLKGADGSFKTVVYLSWDELMALYNLEIPSDRKYLERVRDVFCFCCFTGLRYSDAFNLSKGDIQRERIRVITQKTIDPIYIELNKYSTALLEKYENFSDDRALPVISNQKMNDYLKILGDMAELNEPVKMVWFIGNERHDITMRKADILSTHCGRRTFIVLALRLGIPATVIMKWTGHKTFNAMRPYVEIVDALKEEEMRKFDVGVK